MLTEWCDEATGLGFMAGFGLGTCFGTFLAWLAIRYTLRVIRSKVDFMYHCMKEPP